MQNMPGRNNNIPYGNGTMTNWWAFTGAGMQASIQVWGCTEILLVLAALRTRLRSLTALTSLPSMGTGKECNRERNSASDEARARRRQIIFAERNAGAHILK